MAGAERRLRAYRRRHGHHPLRGHRSARGRPLLRGAWTRKGDTLEGKFRVVFAAAAKEITEGTVGATIKDANTLSVSWHGVTWLDKPTAGTWTWRGKGEVSWTKQ